MWLPMEHALTRNRTFAALDDPNRTEAKYTNIRTIKREQMVQGGARFDGDELWSLPPPPPPSPPVSPYGPHPTSYYGWMLPNSSTVREFSAACWYFAQELTDIAASKGEPLPVIGLVQSAWGGSEIDDWLKNDTIATCKNTSGYAEKHHTHGKQPKDWASNAYTNNGALWNGMVAPFVNMTIYGVLYYQGVCVCGARLVTTSIVCPHACATLCATYTIPPTSVPPATCLLNAESQKRPNQRTAEAHSRVLPACAVSPCARWSC